MDDETWTEMDVKVALAVAILRNKPHGIDAKDYTEMLQRKMQMQYRQWRNENVDRAKQLLRLKQQMVLLHLNHTSSLPLTFGTGCDDVPRPSSTQLTFVGQANVSSATRSTSTNRMSSFNYSENLLDAYLTVTSLELNSQSDDDVSRALYTLLNSLLAADSASVDDHLAVQALMRIDEKLIKKNQQVLDTFWKQLITDSILDNAGPITKCAALKVLGHVALAPNDRCHLRSSVADALINCLNRVVCQLAQVTEHQNELRVDWWENSIYLVDLLEELLSHGGHTVRQHCRDPLLNMMKDCTRRLMSRFPLFVHVICQLNGVANMATDCYAPSNYAFEE